jgi:hypothetical protein
MMSQARVAAVLMACCAILGAPRLARAGAFDYACSAPPLEVTFAIRGDHYSGAVECGNLFLQTDIPTAPVVRWPQAKAGALYALTMIDFDGNAHGSWPDHVPPGDNAPVRHWIVANIPGDLLRGRGYREADATSRVTVLQPYRDPHIPVVSDRYGVYLFEQDGDLKVEPVAGPITNFRYAAFLEHYHLTKPVASNVFVVIYTSDSPFSGKPFHGNDVSGIWHQGYGTGRLAPPP